MAGNGPSYFCRYSMWLPCCQTEMDVSFYEGGNVMFRSGYSLDMFSTALQSLVKNWKVCFVDAPKHVD